MPEATVQNPTPAQPNPADIHRKQSLTLAVAIILFVLGLGLGILKGFGVGKDQTNLENVATLKTALDYFHTDQDRYPTQDEFDNQQILVPYYMSAMPIPENASGSCKTFTKYIYAQQDPQNYALQFCLNNGLNGWNKGLNTLQNEQ